MDWFRTDAGFTSHRDFLKLRKELALSRPALAGHMVLLFEAVAKHEEYGDLSTTPDEVIEEWVEWPRDRAGQFTTALKSVGWIKVDGEFSGWIERHKGMLKARDNKRAERKKRNSKRLRDEKRTSRGMSGGRPADMPRTSHGTDADIPPYRTEPNRTVPTKDEHPSSAPTAPTSQDRVNELFERWNVLAKSCGLPTAAQITQKRRAAAQARIKAGLLDRWPEFATALEASRWHRGENDRGWRANVDWLLRPDSWIGLLERAGPAPESADARRSRRLDVLTAAVFARVDFGATGKIPRLFGDALLDLRCDERTIGIRRDPTGKIRDVRLEFVEVRLLDAMDADGVPDSGIAAWAAREVQIIHPPATAQDRPGVA